MKRKVIITFEVEVKDYHDTRDTIQGTHDLVKAMLEQEADLPNQVSVEVNGPDGRETKTVNVGLI